VCDADTYLTTLEERTAYLSAFIKHAGQQTTTSVPLRETTMESSRESTKIAAAIPDAHEVEVVKKPLHKSTVTATDTVCVNSEPMHISETHNYSNLPKLSLPNFKGNPLQW